MWYHASAMNTLQLLTRSGDLVEKDGIYVAKSIASKTVWDKLALENPTHAVISAADEASAVKKSAAQIEHIKSFVHDDSVLLDYGCGYGRVAKYLLPQKTIAGYVGLDSAYDMLQLFRDRYQATPAEQSTPVLFLNADINATPLHDDSIDVAIVCAVFLHNHKSVVYKSMAELSRVMKSGGVVLVYGSFPRVATLMGVQGYLYQCLLNILGRPFKNGPVRYYSAKEITSLFADFAEVDLVPVGYNVLPKSLIFLPGFLDTIWRTVLANPINAVLEKITPQFLKCYFAVHFDVIAKR